jgi:hypothetical protein
MRIMTRRRGAPRTTEREDPLSFVLRSRPAREILEVLEGHSLMIPLEVQKTVNVHPETFRRIISNLDAYALVSVRAMGDRAGVRRGPANSFRIPIGIEITKGGKRLLQVAHTVRQIVERNARLLPESSAEHWLRA